MTNEIENKLSCESESQVNSPPTKHGRRVWRFGKENRVSRFLKTNRISRFLAGNRISRYLQENCPRIETLFLLISMVCVTWGKADVIRGNTPPGGFGAVVMVILPDIVFFTAVFLLYQGLYEWKASARMARLTLALSFVIAVWSVLNLGWMLESRSQFQPGYVRAFFTDLGTIGHLVWTHLDKNRLFTILLLSLLGFILGIFIWKMIRPNLVQPSWVLRSRRIVISMGIIGVALLLPALQSNSNSSLTNEALAVNSHWHSLVSLVSSMFSKPIQTRNIPMEGQREVQCPPLPQEKLPNVVLVLWESLSYATTSLADPQLDTTPFLKELAQQGVEMRQTRALVSHTSKAFWSVLTGSTPVIQQDYVEAMPIDTCYESLATLLSRAGYRSGFFEMSVGTFECAPGMFHNLGFDWAWFRENLQDDSANLGYMAGDDYRMLQPALEWATQETGPFFLMFMTSISHDPFEVPSWYGQEKKDRFQNYLQSLRCSDDFLKKLCQQLQQRGLARNTILCVLGDHGANLQAWVGGRVVPYEELIRIPWVITWPGRLAPQEPIEWPCSQLDVTPTLLKLIGYDISHAGFEGKDAFVPSPENRRSYFSAWYEDSPLGFIEGNRKIIYWPFLDKVFSCDLEKDPQEKNYIPLPEADAERYKRDILDWQQHSQIVIHAKWYSEKLFFQHWRVYCISDTAWASYVP
jgi:glucan phosphoethanolaminetransferase (alkaline phosphatase superfamily)